CVGLLRPPRLQRPHRSNQRPPGSTTPKRPRIPQPDPLPTALTALRHPRPTDQCTLIPEEPVNAPLCETCLVTWRLATVLSTMCRCTGNPSPTVMRSSRSHERTRRRCTPPRQPSRRHVLAEAASRRLQRRLLPNRPPSVLQGHH